jgi:hypothetical protein
MMGQGLGYKNISCGHYIVFVVLQINVVTEAAYYSKAPVIQTTLDCNLILKQIITEKKII